MRTIKYTNQVSLVFPSRSARSFARSAAAATPPPSWTHPGRAGDVKP